VLPVALRVQAHRRAQAGLPELVDLLGDLDLLDAREIVLARLAAAEPDRNLASLITRF
jgi:hypothetical protein